MVAQAPPSPHTPCAEDLLLEAIISGTTPRGPASPGPSHAPLPTPHSPPPRTHLSEELVNLLVSAFRDPSLSLDEIAAHLKVPLSTLALWLTSPQVTQQVNHLNSINVWRTRTIATAALPTAAKALARMTDEYMAETNEPRDSARGPSPSPLPTSAFPLPTSPPYLRYLALSQRRHDSARRASALLSRLARTPNIPDPNSTVPPTAAAPKPQAHQPTSLPSPHTTTTGERSVREPHDTPAPPLSTPTAPNNPSTLSAPSAAPSALRVSNPGTTNLAEAERSVRSAPDSPPPPIPTPAPTPTPTHSPTPLSPIQTPQPPASSSNPQSQVRNPQSVSPSPNPQSEIPNPNSPHSLALQELLSAAPTLSPDNHDAEVLATTAPIDAHPP